MNRRLIATLLSAACAVAPLALFPATGANAQSVSRPATDIAISIGRGQLVTVPGRLADVFVANDQVADVQVKSANQLYVFGKAGGVTTVYASNAAGDIIWSANVKVGSNLDSIDQMLALAMPEANIQVATMASNTVLLTGTVAAPEDAAEAERLAAAFLGEGAHVVSRLRMATPLQVNLRVRFAEVSRSLVRSLGINLTSVDVSSAALSSSNITAIDSAITTVSTLRGNLGAFQNRFERTISNLSVTTENLSASESRIRDTDMASEMMSFTRAQILQQAGTAMLAQANAVPQSVLQLLK